MKKSSLTALLVVIVFATLGVPGYVTAQSCDPGSGCCGTGQTYVGQQLFQNPAGPYQVSVAPTASPGQPVNVTNITSSANKTRSAQTKIGSVVPVTLQAGKLSDARSTAFSPFFGNLW